MLDINNKIVGFPVSQRSGLARNKYGTPIGGAYGMVLGVVCLCIFFFFHYEDIVAGGSVYGEVERIYVAFGIPLRDVTLLSVGVAILGWSSQFFKRVGYRLSLGFILCCLFYFTLGVINGANPAELRADARVVLWFAGGAALGMMLAKCAYHEWVLYAVVVYGSLAVLRASLQAGSMINTIEARITHPTIFLVGSSVISACMLIIGRGRHALISACVLSVGLGTHFYATVIQGITRSSVIFTGVVLLCWVAVWASSTRRRLLIYSGCTVLGGALLVSYLQTRVGPEALTWSRYERLFANPLKQNVEESRLTEVRQLFEQKDWKQLTMGSGLGGSIASEIYQNRKATVMHVGIFNVWLKFGIVPFLIICIWFYGIVPFKLVNAFWIERRERTQAQRGIIGAYPVFLLWGVHLALSGGYSEVSSLWGGIAYYLWRDTGAWSIKTNPAQTGQLPTRKPIAFSRITSRGFFWTVNGGLVSNWNATD